VSRREAVVTTRPGAVAQVARMVDELARSDRLAPEVVADMQVALDEVLVNIIRYAWEDDRVHEIRVRLTTSPGAFEAEIEDDGRPFDPLSVARPETQGSLAERKVGGLGIHFVKSLMSDVAYTRVDHRNRLFLRRRWETGQAGDARGSAEGVPGE
jgi:anti-sigma regulatory factor (Ser/Thr protein kinase)